MQEVEIIKEFLVESNENLNQLDREMVELEQRPKDAGLLASIFRTLHTIKGTCGFLGFGTLETIAHHAENILGQLRSEQRDLNPTLVSIILEAVDAVKAELASIEAIGKESGANYADLLQRLRTIMRSIDSVSCLPSQLSQAKSENTSISLIAQEIQQIVPEPANSASTPQLSADLPTKFNGLPYGKRQTDVKTTSVAESTIRVDVSLLNRLMNLVGELVLARNQILQFNARYDDSSLNTTAQKLNLITSELQEGIMRTRMQPISIIWNNLPRVVRDLATSQGKQIELQMDGAETELDKTIIEAIKDPLTHIVRNACDHGIESLETRVRAHKPAQGKLSLSAFHEGGNVNIEIADDGAGIDPQIIKASAIEKGLIKPEKADRMSDRELANLVFLPGFSTAKQISNISGRGVGMDVVKTNIERIGGTVDLISKPGHGTAVKIKIPLTLAIVPGLVITSGSEPFIIPQVSLLELVRLEGEKVVTQIELINGTPVYRRRGHLLPLTRLNEILKLTGAPSQADAVNIIVLQAEERQFGLIVDEICDTQEIVVKPLGSLLKSVKAYAGATIMGDGRVALILDVLGIAQLSGILGEAGAASESRQTDENNPVSGQKQELLLFRAGNYERLAVPLSLVARLEEFSPSKIEYAAGGLVVQYRGRILPLIPLARQLGYPALTTLPDPVFVVVFADGDNSFGVVVDQILDIVEEAITVKRASGHQYLLGSAVVGGKITDFLDMHAITEEFIRPTSLPQGGQGRLSTILVADHSSFARGLVRSYLEIAGHHVLEASTCAEAVDRINKDAVDVVMAALELPDGGALGLLESIQRRSLQKHIPVIALQAQKNSLEHTETQFFSDCFFKFDRIEISRSLERLAKAMEPVGNSEKELMEACQ